MALEIEKSFTVKAPADAVWSFLTDVNRVARCMPGAAITGQLDERTYTGTMSVKVGPVASSYKGKIVFERLDAAARTAEIVATGQDIKGKGGADMRLASALRAVGPGETEVVTTSKVNITGVLAQMGRGMIQDVSDQMFGIFSERMRAELEAAAGVTSGEAAVVAGPLAEAVTAPLSTSPVPAPAPAPAAPPADDGAAIPSPAAPVAAREVEPAPPPASAAAASEVLDLGAIGAKVARSTALRALSSPVFWLIALAIGVVVLLLVR